VGIDTTYISPGAVAVVALRPAQIMTSPMAEMLPTEVATAAGLKYLGFDPADVDEAIAFVDMSNPMAPPSYGLSIKFNKPFKGSAIPQELRGHAQLGELNGKKYLQSQHPMMPSFYGPNNMTLIVAPDATLRQIVEAKGQDVSGPIFDRVRAAPAGSDLYAAVDVASLRPLIQMGLSQPRAQVPPEFQQYFDAPNLVSAAELTVNIVKPGTTSLIVHASDEAAATQLETLVADASNMYQERMKAQFAAQAASDDPVEQAMAKYAERISGSWTKSFAPTREGTSLVLFRTEVSEQNQQQKMVAMAVIGVLVALLLPAIQAAREAARRNQSMNNLKQMMLALHMYHDTKKTFPAHASYSDDGKPLLSWRVHILPFIEEQALYEQFRLDEPWDSEHNKALIARMPQVFQNPNFPNEPGKTNYLAVVGDECIFNGTKDGVRLQDITDGTSKTIALVEADADQAVEWTKPDDWEYNAETPNAGLGNLRPGVWMAAISDGSVQAVAEQIDLNVLKAMFTRAGGEVIP
jgi:type II secretory pathway pseudopilin PulG